MYSGRPQKFGLFLADLNSAGARLMLEGHVGIAYVPPGYLLVVKGTSVGSTAVTLLAQPFDATRLVRTGDLHAVADRIAYDTLAARPAVSASTNGTLVYANLERRSTRLVWFDRSGTPLGNVGASGAFHQPALSPDGKTVAVQRIDPETQDSDIWAIDTARGAESRITSYGNLNFNPVWSSDGTRIVFSSARLTPPNLYQTTLTAAGGEQLLLKSTFVDHATDWSRDGRFIVYESLGPKNGWDLMLLPMAVPDVDRKPVPFLQTAFDELDGRVSPDGRWLAYVSDESGSPEVYARTFPESGGKRRISINGGVEPKWRGDGKELFYLAADGSLMAVYVKPAAVFEAGTPMALFKTRVARDIPFAASYTVAGDGRRFLIRSITDEVTSVPTKIVFNWPAALGRH
jgi:dipeptidyl aminopeptidase/acylaminoacyl peptidase